MTEHNCPACDKAIPNMAESRYCPFCGVTLGANGTGTGLAVSPDTALTPAKENILFEIGQYQILETIGKGGMGEVHRSYDTVCGRIVALKEIRADLKKYKRLHKRFLHEARITSQLTHPTIMPIYSIHYEKDRLYYTMPYVAGDTLKQRLRRARDQRRDGKKIDHEAEIPALTRIFLAICQAIAYSHSHCIIHRDLKPENIILGNYGEVLILDWGLGQRIGEADASQDDSEVDVTIPPEGMTHPGRIVGTLNYMAPERAIGDDANYQTDIYALGVTLYQILTLRMPFQRDSFKEYQDNWEKERLSDPVDIAPYRDVPRILSRIVKRALHPDPQQRYQTVEEMIHELEHYTEGRSEWFEIAELNPKVKDHWEFQEHVFIADNVAITTRSDEAHWVNLMVSKSSVTGNAKLEANVRLSEQSRGIGFLLNVPEAKERDTPYDGYCLWLGSDLNKTTCLLRSSQEVLDAHDIFLRREEWYHIKIEKVGNKLNFYLNKRLQLSFVSHLPIVGTHAGLISRDSQYDIRDFRLFVSSLSLTVDCLAVPHAFLASGDFERARNEYHRISEAFPGRSEGRDALFHAGVSYIEQARNEEDIERQQRLLDLAREEFEKLRATPGAPLEYLGKALVYRAERESEEEVKCYELAYRRYAKHPLLPTIREQVVYRIHETSRHNRSAAYSLILLALRRIPEVATGSYMRKLLNSLQQHWETLPWLEEEPACESNFSVKKLHFGTVLAFWLGKPFVLLEIIDDLIQEKELYPIAICNALMALIELGCTDLARDKMKELLDDCFDEDRLLLERPFKLLAALLSEEGTLTEGVSFVLSISREKLSRAETRIIFHLMELALDDDHASEVPEVFELIQSRKLSFEDSLRLDAYRIWAHLRLREWELAGKLLHYYPVELLNKESSILHSLYGCWLRIMEGKEISHVHFSGVLETTFPRSWVLLSYYLNGKIAESRRWFRNAFLWEKRQLYRQLSLYYHCIGNDEKTEFYQRMEEQEYLNVSG